MSDEYRPGLSSDEWAQLILAAAAEWDRDGRPGIVTATMQRALERDERRAREGQRERR